MMNSRQNFTRVAMLAAVALLVLGGLGFAVSMLFDDTGSYRPATVAHDDATNRHQREVDAMAAGRGNRNAGANANSTAAATGENPATPTGDPNAGTHADSSGNTGNGTLVPGARDGLTRTDGVRIIDNFRGVRIPGFSGRIGGNTRTARDGQSSSSSANGGTDSGASAGTGDGHTSTETPTDETGEEEPPTTGTVAGQVTGRDGDGVVRPIAGLTVSILRDETVNVDVADDSIRFDAVTDANGVYVADGIPPGPVRVTIPTTVYRADAHGYEVATSQLYFEPVTRYGEVVVGETTAIDLFVSKAFDLVGRCIGPDGLPLDGATIKIWLGWSFYDYGRLNKPDRIAVSDANGIFRFADLGDDSHRLTADKSGFSTIVVEKFRPSDYGPINPCELVFGVSTTVEGRVFDANGVAIEGARVTGSHYVEGGRYWKATVLTDANGAYMLPVEPESINTITASKTGFGNGSADGILPGRNGLDFFLKANGQGGAAGKVIDVDGRLAAQFEVNGVAFENAEGRFDLPLPPGDHTLTIFSARSGGVARVPVSILQGQLLDVGLVALSAGRPVDVIVLMPDAAGFLQPIGDAKVALLNTGESKGPLVAGQTVYGFEAVPDGEAVQFRVTHALFPPRTVSFAAEELPVRPQVVEIELMAGAMEALVQVTDLEGKALANASVTWLSNGQPGRAFVTDETGIAHLTGIPNSPVAVKVEAAGFVSQTVNVPAAVLSETVTEPPATTVILQPGGSVWGIVTARGLPLPANAPLPTITLRTSVGNRETVPVQVTMAGGAVSWRYEFRDVPTGEAWISSDGYQCFARQPVMLDAATATQADVNLPGRTTLRVTVRNANGTPAPNLTAYLYTLDTWTVARSEASGPNGAIDYHYVPPGGWVASVITHGSSDQRMYAMTVPEGVETFDHTITLPDGGGSIDGRVLIENPAVPYSESAPVLAGASVSNFTLAIRMPDDVSIEFLQVSGANFTDAASVVAAINASPSVASIGIQAEVDGARVKLSAISSANLPFFGAVPFDANAKALFGAAPFASSHRAANCKVSLEHLDVPLQTLLAGYISIDSGGYFTFGGLVPGQYRPRVVPHYTNAQYAYGFGNDVTVPAPGGSMPFVTIWTTGAGTYADVTGTIALAEPGQVFGGHVIVYVDDLDDPASQLDTSLTSHRAITRRSGYYFGGFSGRNGSWSVPRLKRGHRYRASIHVMGLAPTTVDFEIPANAATATAPPVQMTFDPRFVAGN